ncbi:MAG TPA: WYL domain-containing protein [Acidimicrobiales bacterium]|jgi:predicted DNA-binding transcriptional regulator YafY|nr:WYL domain-containing protein [Acidimicrobiales bacterium]
MSAAKLERLLKLIAALLDTSVPLRADDIRARIDGYPESDMAFRRAFERDKEHLRDMGIPLRVLEVPGTNPPDVGYRIVRSEYSGKDPDLSHDELAALHLAASLVQVQGIESDDALRKLGGVAGASQTAPLLAAIPNDPRLTPLFRAATELCVVVFRYKGVERAVEPYRLTFSRGQWYLSAYDRVREDERLFRVDRIEGEVRVGPPGAFTKSRSIGSDPRVRAWELGDDDPIDARVLVDADQAMWAVHALGPDAVVETRQDGGVVLHLTVRNAQAFRSFVLSFLEHAEVLAPPVLRADVVAWLEAIAR